MVPLVEVKTDSVLYLRALSASVNGMIYLQDPISKTGISTNTPNQSNAVLDPFRDPIILPNLNAPVAGKQSLRGTYANLTDVEIPTISPPTNPVGTDFNYDVRTNDFADCQCILSCG